MDDCDYKSILRYRSMGLSTRCVAAETGVNKSTVARICQIADHKGIVWENISELSDTDVKQQLLDKSCNKIPKVAVDMEKYLDWLSQKKTKAECWDDYHQTANPANCLHRSQFYARLKAAADELKLQATKSTSIRRQWLQGDYIQIDYAGDTIDLELDDGSHTKINIFVGILCFSRYVFAYATKGQTRKDWLEAMAQMLIAFGGTTKFMLFDNTKALVKQPDPYNPILCEETLEFADYYKMELINTRIVTPRDKGAVENAVKQIQNGIKKYRKKDAYRSIEDIQNLLDYVCKDLNNKVTSSFPRPRAELLEKEKPFLGPLPSKPFTLGDTIKQTTVLQNNFVKINGHFYSVPYQYIGKEVKCRITADRQLQILDINSLKEIAIHLYFEPDDQSEGTTHYKDEHFPPNSPSVESMAKTLYAELVKVSPIVEEFLSKYRGSKSWEQKRRNYLFLKHLIKVYKKERVCQACLTAINMDSITLDFVEKILRYGQEALLATEANIDKTLIERLRKGKFLRDATEFDFNVRSPN